MAVDISRLVLEIDSNGVVKASGNLDVFKQKTKEAAAETTKLEKSAKGARGGFADLQLILKNLPGPLQSVAAGMLGLVSPATAAITAIMGLGSAAAQFGKDSLRAFGEFELIRANLELTMGSAEEAGRIFSQVKDFSMKTPFDVEGTARAVSMLKQAGVASKDLISTVETLGNVSGGNMERFNRIAYNYVQVLQKGVLDARDAKEFAGNLVPINNALRELGITGQATADDMAEAFKHMTREGSMFYDSLNRQGDTYIGKINQAKEAWTLFKAAVAENTGPGDAAKEFLAGLAEAINNYTTFFNTAFDAKRKPDDPEARTNALKAQRTLYQEELEFKMKEQKVAWSAVRALSIKSIENELSILNEEINSYQKILDANNAINDALAARAAREEDTRAALERSYAGYLTLQEQIAEAYGKTDRGRKEALEAEIGLWKERLNSTHYEGFDRWGARTDDKSKLSYYKPTGVSDGERSQIEAVIEALTASLGKMGERAADTRRIFADWVELLAQATGYSKEQVEAWKGLKTVESFGADVRDIVDRMMSDSPNGVIYEILGLDKEDVYRDAASRLQGVIRMMTEAKIKDPWSISDESYTKAMELYAEWKELADGEGFDKALSALRIQGGYIGMDDAEKKRSQYLSGISEYSPAQQTELMSQYDANVSSEINAFNLTYIDNLQHQLDLLKMSRDERERQLLVDQGINKAYVDQALSLQRQIAQQEILKTLLEDITRIPFTAMVGTLHEMGRAFQDGSASADELSEALRDYVGNVIKSLPQLLLGAGLQTLALNWKLGLALIGASGLLAFVGGLIDADDAGSSDDTYDKLQSLQDQITRLIDAQKEQEEYYRQKRRSLNADHAINSYSVNDAIITPGGVINTHPDDYILAMKRPETLTRGNAAIINVQVINNTPAQVSVRENAEGDVKNLMLLIKNDIKNDFAAGGFDGAFNAMRTRMGGVRRNV